MEMSIENIFTGKKKQKKKTETWKKEGRYINK